MVIRLRMDLGDPRRHRMLNFPIPSTFSNMLIACFAICAFYAILFYPYCADISNYQQLIYSFMRPGRCCNNEEHDYEEMAPMTTEME